MDIQITVSGVQIGSQQIGDPVTLREIVSAMGDPPIRSCPPPKCSHPEMAVSVLDDYGVLARHRQSDGALGLLEIFLASSPGGSEPKKSFPGTVWFYGRELVRPLRFSAIPTTGNFTWTYGCAVSGVLSVSFHAKLEFVGRIVIGWRSSVFGPSDAMHQDSAIASRCNGADHGRGAGDGGRST
jgi:hypothetical protein